MMPDDAAIVENPDASRFERRIGKEVAFLEYQRASGHLRLIHTEVPRSARGQGHGEALVEFALEHAKREGLHVIPVCPFVRAYLQRHPEYVTLMAED